MTISSRIMRVLVAYLIGMICITNALPVFADDEDMHEAATRKPLWEAGVGLGAISLPDYPGADKRSLYALPYPHIVYRGERLRAGRGGIRGLLYDNDWLELNLSTGGSLPVNSNDNPAREGMPDLGPSIELGPSLRIKLLNGAEQNLQLRLDVRAHISLRDFPDSRHEGWLFHPQLRLSTRLNDRFSVRYVVDALYGDRHYHDYFYSVSDRYVTAERPAYRASGGRGGYGGSVFFRWEPNRDWRGSLGFRYLDLNDAAFGDSPLVRQNHAGYVFLSVSRTFWRSTREVVH